MVRLLNPSYSFLQGGEEERSLLHSVCPPSVSADDQLEPHGASDHVHRGGNRVCQVRRYGASGLVHRGGNVFVRCGERAQVAMYIGGEMSGAVRRRIACGVEIAHTYVLATAAQTVLELFAVQNVFLSWGQYATMYMNLHVYESLRAGTSLPATLNWLERETCICQGRFSSTFVVAPLNIITHTHTHTLSLTHARASTPQE